MVAGKVYSMKTAKEWIQQRGNTTSCKHPHLYLCDIRDIQLDAMKEGMQRAAKKISHEPMMADAILTAAEQLTEKSWHVMAVV